MEFFATAHLRVNEALLQRHLTIASLPDWCASISRVLESQGERGEVYCVWGQFRVHREVIRGGVRFSLPGCPNGLQWTLTVDPADPAGKVTVHCTINRREQAEDFVESIRQFAADWQAGLEAHSERFRARPPAPGEAMPWYG